MFLICVHWGMKIATLRKELGLTYAGMAEEIGLKSRGQVCRIEKSGKASVAVALKIEALSGGRIPAADLNPAVALVEQRAG